MKLNRGMVMRIEARGRFSFPIWCGGETIGKEEGEMKRYACGLGRAPLLNKGPVWDEREGCWE